MKDELRSLLKDGKGLSKKVENRERVFVLYTHK